MFWIPGRFAKKQRNAQAERPLDPEPSTPNLTERGKVSVARSAWIGRGGPAQAPVQWACAEVRTDFGQSILGQSILDQPIRPANVAQSIFWPKKRQVVCGLANLGQSNSILGNPFLAKPYMCCCVLLLCDVCCCVFCVFCCVVLKNQSLIYQFRLPTNLILNWEVPKKLLLGIVVDILENNH